MLSFRAGGCSDGTNRLSTTTGVRLLCVRPRSRCENRALRRSRKLQTKLRWIDDLLSGQETAFITLVELYYPSMIRLALLYVKDRPVAEEVVQETWGGCAQWIASFRASVFAQDLGFQDIDQPGDDAGEEKRLRTVPFSAFLSSEVRQPRAICGPFTVSTGG